MALRLKNYIDGKWQAALSRKTFKSINPANGRTIATVARSDTADVDLAIHAARKAYQKWRLVPAPKRAELLRKAAQLIEERKSKLGNMVMQEMGKVKPESYGDVQEAIDMGFYFAGEGRRLHGQTTPSELPNKIIRTERHPVGVFALITPWNFPTAIPAWKLFPSLVCGNTVVFKPSQYTPSCAKLLVDCFVDAGIPPGVLNLVFGKGSEAGEAIIQHDGIDGVSFTGHKNTGAHISSVCAPKYKTVSLEMGSKNAIIVMDDANLDLAVDGVIWAGFGTTGQRCTAGSRVIVHEKIYHTFKKKLLKAVKKLRVGPASDKKTQIGPLINQDQLEKTEKYMDIAAEEGLKKLCGGKRALTKGYFFAPTLFDDVRPKSRLFKEEIFGPVVGLTKAKNLPDAVKLANHTDYGLSASIFTQDVNNAHIASRDLNFGLVYVNTSTIGAEIHVPFGGTKATGNGHREAGGKGGALETYSEWKTINVDYSGKIQKAQGIDW